MIELRSLGRAEIHTQSAILTPSQVIVFATALYLIMERARPVSRCHLARLLWPAAKQTVQAHRLRQTLYQLKSLGFSLNSDRTTIQISERSRTDVNTVCDSRQDLAEMSDVEFLPGYVPKLSEEFQDWLDRQRESVHSSLTRALLPILRDARNSGNWVETERISRHCLRLDPYNEAAILAHAEACAMRGQKATAVSILERYSAELAPRDPVLTLPATILRRRVLQADERRTASKSRACEPEFVGRRAEMTALTQYLADARKGFGCACVIDGGPGVGKTRLSSELARFAELQGITVERVACKRSDADQPLSAFVALIPKLRELPGALGCSRETLSWLKRLTEFDASDQMPAATEDSGVVYTHLRSSVFDLLDAVSDERCLLTIVEDIQWLDRASARLFSALLEWVPEKKILFLFNCREAHSPLTEGVSQHRLGSIHLDPLTDSDAATLVRRVMSAGGQLPPGDDVDWLVQTCEGNPFFLQELTKHWMESGEREQVPPSVATLLDERLSRLSDVSGQLLQTCAVLGEHANFERVEQVLGHRPQELLSGIQELSLNGMLRAAPASGPAQTLLIRHDLLSIEVIKSLAPASLAFLHRRCAYVLEREALGSSISISLMRACAFHWHRSGDSERAYKLAIKCADHLLEIGLAEDAAAAFEGALGFCPTLNERLEVLGRIIQANRMAKNWPALLTAIAQFRTLQDSAGQPSRHDDMEVIEFEAHRTTDSDLRPLFAKTLDCVYDRSLAVAHRVSVACVAVKLASSIPDLEELERVYQAIHPVLDESSISIRQRLQLTVVFHTMCGDLQEAVQSAKARVAFERTEGTTIQLVNAITDLAFVLRRAGPIEEMLEALREGYLTAIDHKHFAAARDCAEKLGSLLEDEESPGSAEWMERAKADSPTAGDLHSNFSYNADATRIALRENRLADARRYLNNKFDWAWVRARAPWHAALLGLRIRLLMKETAPKGDVAVDVEALRQLYANTARLGRQDYEIAALANGLIYVNEQQLAKTYLQDYISHKRRDLVPPSREIIATAHSLGIVQLENGQLGVTDALDVLTSHV